MTSKSTKGGTTVPDGPNSMDRQPLDSPETAVSSPPRAIALLEEWLADESGYDEETWSQLKEALTDGESGRRKAEKECSRDSYRPKFG
jgi:hypothetical protein